MKKWITLFLAFQAAFAYAQTADPVLMNIAGEEITKSEFERVYRKNNNKENLSDPAAVREYLDLYINYRLKVKEAEAQHLDSSEAFKTELSGYRKQLAQPYLTDKDVSESLVREAYERLQKDVKAAHILVKLSPDALPKDTAEAYKRILIIRDFVTGKTTAPERIAEYEALVKNVFKKDTAEANARILSLRSLLKSKTAAGERFQHAAQSVSDDPSAKDNNGELGYFTGMMMVYPFETAAYNTKPGDISMPVRTKFGYHIIRVEDIRPAQGEIHAAHIMIKCPASADDSTADAAHKKINEIYGRLNAGEKFEDLAMQFSDDKGSAKTGGVLPWFGTGRMVPEFERAAFSLKKDGDYSEPVRTSYGWHVIRRLETRGVPSFEDKKAELKNSISRDSRSELSRATMISKIKKEYGFKEMPKVKDEFVNALDTTVSNGEFKTESMSKFNKLMFTLGTKNFTQADFASYIASHQTNRRGTPPQAIGYSMYENFVNDKCIEYEESRLDEKYPDFRNLMREYRDGILLFDLTDRMVWSKAVKDSAGLHEYYELNKGNYMWGERVEAVIYTCANKDMASKSRKFLKKKGVTQKDLLTEINKDSQLNLSIKEGKFSKGDNEFLDGINWSPGLSADVEKNGQVMFADIKRKIAPEPKTIDEAKGLITADYQGYLEKTWIDSLKKKYSIRVNDDVLKTVGK